MMFSGRFLPHLFLRKKKEALFMWSSKNQRYSVNISQNIICRKQCQFHKTGKKNRLSGMFLLLENWRPWNIESLESWEKNSNSSPGQSQRRRPWKSKKSISRKCKKSTAPLKKKYTSYCTIRSCLSRLNITSALPSWLLVMQTGIRNHQKRWL